jgi:sortase A
VVVSLFAGYELWGTGVAEARSQHRLAREFAGAAAPDRAPAIPGGRVIGEIQIPRIGVNQYFVDGVSESDLRLGPGHYPGTPYPGQPGNAAIAGHRTTYGAPFFDLNELRPGDPIVTRTRAGRFLYMVRRVFVVAPTQTEVLQPTPDNQLTLTTCNPRYSARQRLIVVASLKGNAVPAPSLAPVGSVPSSATSPGLAGDAGAWPAAVVWGLVLAVIWVLMRIGWRSGRRRGLSVALGIAVALVVLWPLFETLVRLLPADI